jgi:AGCS family alanine or glycine:cation symporter
MADVQAELLDILNWASSIVWGPPLLVFLVGTGIYLTWKLRFLQLRVLGRGLYLGLVVRREPGHQPGDISHFEALMTALAATVGTGNIAGVATAIAAGGPGAMFWMWVTGIFGMATKYAEAILAVRYRHRDASGTMSGGPMYYIRDGLGLPWLGAIFAVFTAIAAFGIGNMVQSNSVADAAASAFSIPHWLTGVVMALATAAVILGGIRSIGHVTGVLVPIMIVFYMAAGLFVLLRNIGEIPAAFGLIFSNAFTPTAAAGGFLGATVMRTVQMGVARGVFSNESGLGSAAIAAAAAQTHSPAAQAMVSMTQTFIDTIIVCTMTGLVILTTGVWTTGDTGASLTTGAFAIGLPGENAGAVVVATGLILFAYSTLLGWSYYGEKAMTYLFGERAVMPYRIVFCALIVVGAVAKLDLVWAFADVMNGLMAVPNLIALIGLAGVVVAETQKMDR